MPSTSGPGGSYRGDFRQDLSRYRELGLLKWAEPSIWAIAVYRFGRWTERRAKPIRLLARVLYLPLFWLATLASGIYLPRHCDIGPGLRIWHFGGVILNPRTVIGRNCTLRHDVTFGNRVENDDVPTAGDDLEVGAGARILGKITIGNGVSIGANAVVIHDVPDGHSAVGIPARNLPKNAAARR